MRTSSRGQAVTELAILLPLAFLLFFGVIVLLVYFEANLELSAATQQAAQAAAHAPVGRLERGTSSTQSRRWAESSYQGSLTGNDFLIVDGAGNGLDSAAGGYPCERDPINPANGTVRCHGHASVRLSQSPLALVGVRDVGVDAYATAYAPTFRSR